MNDDDDAPAGGGDVGPPPLTPADDADDESPELSSEPLSVFAKRSMFGAAGWNASLFGPSTVFR